MSNNKQSSIDFFWNQLPEILPFSVDTETAVKLWGAFEQAKEMHKEEIMEFVYSAVRKILDEDRQNPFNLEQYYNETFGGNNEQK